MTQNPSASDWAAARGEKWRSQAPRMEATLKPVDEPLIRELTLDAPRSVADVGCGGGATTLEILRQAPRGSVVRGFDVSPALIELARERARSEEGDIAFEVADVSLVTPENRFDRLVSRFGVMFFADHEAAFANLLQWLAPGGRFAFAVWGPLSDNPWMTIVRDVVAGVVDVPALDPEAPGPFRYAEAEKLPTVLARVGFAEVAVHDWRGALAMGGGLPAPEAARFALTAFSTFGELLAKAGEEAFNDACRSLTARLMRYQKDDAVLMQARIHVVTGARPR